MIRLKNLSKTYRMGDVEVRALNGVSLEIEAGDFVAIMGPSGSGKSTLMHLLGLLDTPDAGSYELLGQEVARLDEDQLAQLRSRTVGFVFQQFNLLSRTTAAENVFLPTYYSGKVEDRKRAEELLGEVGLGTRIHHKPNELSGGQQQRVAIARSLINRPRILFADEPTGNLDSKSQTEIMEIFQKLNEGGITIILVTHEEEIAEYAKRVIRMRDGVVVSDERQKAIQAKRPHTASPKQRGDAPSPVGEDGAKRRSGGATLPAKLSLYLTQAIRALAANKVRSGLSMLGITIGVAAVIAMLAIGRGAKDAMEKQLSSLGSNLLTVSPGSRRTGGVSMESGSVTRFTLLDAREIAAGVPNVQATAATVNGRAQVVYQDKNWNTQIQGTVPAYATMRAATPTYGRFFNEEENTSRARVAVIGMTVVRNVFGDINPLGEMIKINRVPFQVIGILPEKGSSGFRDQDDTILIPLNTAMYRLLGKQFVDSIDVQVSSSDAMDSTMQAVKELIIKRQRLPPSLQDSFQIRNMADIQAAVSASSNIMSTLLAVIAAISLLVGGIGIMNIMLVSVTERTREIGLRKAVGARPIDILAQFLIESAATGLIGGISGIVLGAGISWTLSIVAQWTTRVSLDSILIATIFSAGVGIIFGLWPARKAARLNPIEALRFE